MSHPPPPTSTEADWDTHAYPASHNQPDQDRDPDNETNPPQDVPPTDTQEYSLLMDYPSEPDYYALLGLQRTPAPTDAEIRSAFRTLTLSFHPDKQPPAWKEAATRHFDRLRVASETLLDPRKRIVYDMLGAEGVQEEWGTKGAMGRFGEAEMERKSAGKQVGVRAKTPGEFRRWFLEVMKRRERRAVNSMVMGRGSLALGIDASDMVSIDEEAGEVYLHVPHPRMSTFSVAYSFKAPFPTLRTLLGESEKEEDEETTDEDSEKDDQPAESGGTDLRINAGLSGELKEVRQNVTLQLLDGTEEERQVPLPPVFATRNIDLGATFTRSFGDVASSKGILSWRPFSFLSYSGVSVNAVVLPVPELKTTIAKSITPIPGTNPFQLNLTTSCSRSITKCLPTVDLQVSKVIGERKIAFCKWSSGPPTWPDFLADFLAPIVELGMDVESAIQTQTQTSMFNFGFAKVQKPTNNPALMGDDDDDEVEEQEEETDYRQMRRKQRDEDKADESWQAAVAATPVAVGLSFVYARNIFSGKVANPVRSEWSSEGHNPLPPDTEHRSVRVEIQSTVSVDLSVGWHIEGTRQVGDLTRMGLGVGVEGAHGLVVTVSWSRLGQKIRLPISVCPLEMANPDAAGLMLALPWAAYCALEFGFLRPRERKNRRRLIARRQRELKKLVPAKKAASLEAIQLMADQVQRRQDKEGAQNGLVITKAEYGHYPSKKKTKGEEPRRPAVADVTIPIAALVDRSQLVIPKNMVKFHILGFHDPAPLQPKTLKIWYTYHGKEHYVEANDSDGVACPVRSHVLV